MGAALVPYTPSVSTEFSSSRPRDVMPIALMAAAAPQPAGPALPSLAPESVAAMLYRAGLSARLNPPVLLRGSNTLRRGGVSEGHVLTPLRLYGAAWEPPYSLHVLRVGFL